MGKIPNPTIQSAKDNIKYVIQRAINKTKTNREIWSKIKADSEKHKYGS